MPPQAMSNDRFPPKLMLRMKDRKTCLCFISPLNRVSHSLRMVRAFFRSCGWFSGVVYFLLTFLTLKPDGWVLQWWLTFRSLPPSANRISAAQPVRPLLSRSHLWLGAFSSPALCLDTLMPLEEVPGPRWDLNQKICFHKTGENQIHYYWHCFIRRPQQNKICLSVSIQNVWQADLSYVTFLLSHFHTNDL